MRLVRIWTLIAALGLILAAGCKEDPMVRARAAHATEQADQAEKALKEVLAQAPKDFEARRLMADVHRFRGEFDKTEEALEALWKEKGFDKDTKDLPAEVRAQRDLLENQFNDLYSAWSGTLDGEKDAEKFQKVVRAGLKWNKKSPTLNRTLVEHLFKQADAEEKAGKKLEAAQTLESILQLRAMPAQRKDAEKRAGELRKGAFADDVASKFEAQKAELTTSGNWAEDTKTLSFVVEAEVNKRLKAKKTEDMNTARKTATPAIKAAIATWVAKVTGISPELAAVTAVKMSSGDETLKRGAYTVKISMTWDDIVDGAFTATEKARAAKEAAAKASEKPAEAPAEEPKKEEPAGTNAGGEAPAQEK